jgi:hypothetical protein
VIKEKNVILKEREDGEKPRVLRGEGYSITNVSGWAGHMVGCVGAGRRVERRARCW